MAFISNDNPSQTRITKQPGTVTAISVSGDEPTVVNDLTVTDSLTVTGVATLSGGVVQAGAETVTSADASALAVGRQGATAPVLKVNAATASVATGIEIVGAAAASGVNVRAISSGTDENLTINAKGAGTITIALTSTGAVTITPATTVTGALTPTGGVASAGGFTIKANVVHTGGMPARVSTDGTDATPVITEVYYDQIYIPANMIVTGVAIFNGSVASGNYKVGLFNSSGVLVATSASTAMSGTDAYQRVPFTATYAALGPGTYYVGLLIDNTTARYNTHTVGDFVAAKQTGQVYATGFTTITLATTFTTALGPIASLY